MTFVSQLVDKQPEQRIVSRSDYAFDSRLEYPSGHRLTRAQCGMSARFYVCVSLGVRSGCTIQTFGSQ